MEQAQNNAVSAVVGNSNVNPKVYEMLLRMGPASAGIQEAKRELKTREQGAYGIGLSSAIYSTHGVESETALKEARAQWFATIDLLMENIRKDVGGIAATFGAEEADPTNKKGNKYKVPSSVSNIRTVVKTAWELGTPLWKIQKDKDGNTVPVLGEDGLPVPDGITAIMKANSARREDIAKAQREAASPFEKLKAETLADLEKVKEKVSGMVEKESPFVQRIRAMALAILDASAFADMREDAKPAATPAETKDEKTVGAALDAASQAKAQQRASKRKGKNKPAAQAAAN